MLINRDVCVPARVGGVGVQQSSCWSESVGCSRSVATTGPPSLPGQIYSQHRAGSQLALSSPPLMSMADPRQTPLGTGVWQGMGEGRERERERTHLMRSMIHRHPRGHNLEWGNTTHVLTGLSHNSLGLPRLRGTPKERSTGNDRCMLLNATHIGRVLIFKAGEQKLLVGKKSRKQQSRRISASTRRFFSPRFPTLLTWVHNWEDKQNEKGGSL